MEAIRPVRGPTAAAPLLTRARTQRHRRLCNTIPLIHRSKRIAMMTTTTTATIGAGTAVATTNTIVARDTLAGIWTTTTDGRIVATTITRATTSRRAISAAIGGIGFGSLGIWLSGQLVVSSSDAGVELPD